MATHHHLLRRSLCVLCTVSLLPLPGYGATDLADKPLGIGAQIPPAIIFALDDSGSMDYEVLLPTSDGAMWWHTTNRSFTGLDQNDNPNPNVLNFNAQGTTTTPWRKYVYLFPNGTGLGNRLYTDSNHSFFAIPPTDQFAWVRSASYNPLYYDTHKTYLPWIPTLTHTTFENANPSAPKSHPIYGTTGIINLTTVKTTATQGVESTFRLYPGMVLPAGANYRQSNTSGAWIPVSTPTAVTNTNGVDAQIPYYPATFYVPEEGLPDTAPVGLDGKRLKHYEIKPGNTFPSGRSYTDEMQNFANWFTYYRKRHLMLNAAMGSVLNDIAGIRAGVVYFNTLTDVTMYDLSVSDVVTRAKNNKALIERFYKQPEAKGTPTHAVLNYVGQQFQRTGTDAPIQFHCQINAAFVVTDGFANADSAVKKDRNNVSINDVDGDDSRAMPYNRQYSPAGRTDISHPYADKTQKNTLADIAMYYYVTNLNPALLPTGKVPVDLNDTSPNADRNTNLHMNTYGLGLGAKGTIFGIDQAKTKDPFKNVFTWPTLPNANGSPTTIDDLWHATINGRGSMLSSQDVDSTRIAIESVVSEIMSKNTTSAAAVIASPNLTTADNTLYTSSYDATNWTGSLHAWAINPSTGVVSKTDKWNPSVQARLDARPAESRVIVTYDGATGIPFTYDTLTSDQKAKLDNHTSTPSKSDAEAVINYLRGDRSNEYNPLDETRTELPYRYRAHLLGDIVHAQAGLLHPPDEEYEDPGYKTFATTKQNRKRLILQGSNDGMLHAFNITTGEEAWAYIPNRVIEEGLLPALTKKTGFLHHFYVDGTPTIADVDFNQLPGTHPATNPDWHTLFIGSLQKGGRGFYAIDVTSPESMTDAASVASKVLWEFPKHSDSPDAENIGYSFGRPVVVKLSDNKWYVLVSSGYNNGETTGGDGKGWLFLLNPETGDVVYKFATTAGTPKNPSGLAYIAAFKDKGNISAETRFVYGGDLLGNIWRFDLNTPDDETSVGPERLALLVDKQGNPQPITTAPQIANTDLLGTGKKPLVFYGTGRYLDTVDIPDEKTVSQTQTIYGLLDTGTEIGSDAVSLRTQLVEQTFTAPAGTEGSKTRKLSKNTVDYTSGKRGWYVDLNVPGERINVDPILAFGILVFGSNIPSDDICLPGGSSYLNYFDFKTGGFATGSLAYSSTQLGTSMIVGLMFIRTADGKMKVMLTDSRGNTPVFDSPMIGGVNGIRRATWHELATH